MFWGTKLEFLDQSYCNYFCYILFWTKIPQKLSVSYWIQRFDENGVFISISHPHLQLFPNQFNSWFFLFLLPFFWIGHCVRALSFPLLRGGFRANNILSFFIDMIPAIFVRLSGLYTLIPPWNIIFWHFIAFFVASQSNHKCKVHTQRLFCQVIANGNSEQEANWKFAYDLQRC